MTLEYGVMDRMMGVGLSDRPEMKQMLCDVWIRASHGR